MVNRRARRGALAVACALALGVPATAAANRDHNAGSVDALRVDTLTNPIGLGNATPNLSWTLSDGRQTAYQIQVASRAWRLDDPDLWDSGKIRSDDTANIAYAGAPLRSRQSVVWRVRVWDGRGAASRWSAPARWEMGLLSNRDWSAKWIEDPEYTYATDDVPNPLPILAKTFDLSRHVVKARLYMTGLGQYAAKMNGVPVGEAVLEPGQTSYYAEVHYRTYDVTKLLRRNDNLLGIETGSGAYQRVPTPGRYFFTSGIETAPVYGTPKAIAQLELTYADGSRQTIATDGSWQSKLGGTTYSGWWGGEDYDARRVSTDWTASGSLSGSGWREARASALTPSTTPTDTTPLIADQRPPVTVAGEARPLAINQVTRPRVDTTLAAPALAGDASVTVASTAGIHAGDTLTLGAETLEVAAVGADGPLNRSITLTSPVGAAHASGEAVASDPGPTYVLDFGKNLSALPKVSISGSAGTTVTLIPAETANADGTINVSSTGARADRGQILYRYTLSGDDGETWHSQFTYNGFRYLQVTGLAEAPTTRTVTALVTHASNRESASFDSSNELMNSIYDITKQALENNMQSVLTDCPDREKGPYTGDNLHNIDAELTLFDMQAYQTQQVANMRTAQRPTPFTDEYPGLIANIAPEFHHVVDALFSGRWFLDEPNWGGAVIRVPWQLYQVYGDTRAMRENYGAMVKWLDYEATAKAANGGNIRGLGDWASGQPTDAQAIIDYGYYENVSTMVKVADALGEDAGVQRYGQLAASLKDEYNASYLHTDDAGRAWYANNTQASNAVALDAGLVPAQYRQAVEDSLVQAVSAFGNRIGTGSVALGPLFRALEAAGRDDLLYAMVSNPASPGYAFLVESGRTTLTERLDGGGSQDHHFFGQVASWFVHGLAGIEQAPGSIAYERLVIKPALVGDLEHASGVYSTPQGTASSSWTRGDQGEVRRLDVTIPANTPTRVYVPASSPGVKFRAHGDADVRYIGYRDGAHVYDMGDGRVTFRAAR
jgi:alpha-L-rhamnosidase